MSPVAPSSGHAGRALMVATVAVIAIMAVLFLAAVLYGRQESSSLKLGDTTFQGGSTERLSKEIDDRGPIIYTDVSGSADRDIILQHIGSDQDKGWYAFRAQPPDKGRECTWQWQAGDRLFQAKCDESLTAPADGKGLESYPVTVINGRLDVDLNSADRTTTTEATTTTTTIVISGEPNGN